MDRGAGAGAAAGRLRLRPAGRIDFIDVQTDKATDTALVQARDPQPGGILSTASSSASVEGAEPVQAMVIPQSAVQQDQAGTFVLVVGEGNKASSGAVRLGRGTADQVVVEGGLEGGETVITEGVQRVPPGPAGEPAPAPGRRPAPSRRPARQG